MYRDTYFYTILQVAFVYIYKYMTARLLGPGHLVKGVSGAQSRAPCSTSAEAVPGTYLGLNFLIPLLHSI